MSSKQETLAAQQSAPEIAVAYELDSADGIVDDSADASVLPIGRLEPVATKPTLYRDPSSAAGLFRSDAERLAERLSQTSFWRDPELCRDLRALAGLELTPLPTETTLHTPPPLLELATHTSAADASHFPFELVRSTKAAGCL
ncbi:MAG: hypothetical protein QM784_11905 [Polyangiaceae bacterium]